MKVKILKTGKVEEYDASYAARLIEQGKAVKAEEPEPSAQNADNNAKGKATPEKGKAK